MGRVNFVVMSILFMLSMFSRPSKHRMENVRLHSNRLG